MANEEMNWWDDKVILLPKGLLTQDVTGEELAVYAKMKGFGKEARAGLDALATRLGWEVKKVRRHQNELWRKGWLFLMREGANRKPRYWFLATKPFEEPPAEKWAELGLLGLEAVPVQIYQGAQNGQGAQISPPPNPAPEASKVLQASKETLDKRAKRTHAKQPEADRLQAVFKEAWEGRYTNSEYMPSKSDAAQFLAWAKAGVTEEAMRLKVAAHMVVEKGWHLSSWHSVGILERTWNELGDQASAGVPVSQADCKHPYEGLEILMDYGQSVKAKCKCGKVMFTVKP